MKSPKLSTNPHYPRLLVGNMGKAPSPPTTGLDADQLVCTYQAGIWRYLRSLGCDASQADDLTQETFLAVLQAQFDHFSETSTRAYLKRIAFNAFISLKRRSGKVVAVGDLEKIDRAWDELVHDDSGEELIEALQGCLQTLTERARWALQMRFRDKFSRTEIACKLEITEHGAKNLMQRAKKQLRECVEAKTKND